VLERFDELITQLTVIARQSLQVELDTWYEIQNARRSRPGSPSTSELIAKFHREIVAVNALDLQLYDYVRNVLLPRQQQELGITSGDIVRSQRVRSRGERWRDAQRRLLYRLYRNLVYKPHVGRLPLPHRLPIYEAKRQAA
jgi:hypothetical protein